MYETSILSKIFIVMWYYTVYIKECWDLEFKKLLNMVRTIQILFTHTTLILFYFYVLLQHDIHL
jgi:hypothetical protein